MNNLRVFLNQKDFGYSTGSILYFERLKVKHKSHLKTDIDFLEISLLIKKANEIAERNRVMNLISHRLNLQGESKDLRLLKYLLPSNNNI